MEKITNALELKKAIHELENKNAIERILLKEQFFETCNSLKPLNILKDSIRSVVGSPNLKEDVLGLALGMASGYVSKSVVVGASHNPVKKIVGSLLQLGVTNMISKNPRMVHYLLSGISGLFSKKNESKGETVNE